MKNILYFYSYFGDLLGSKKSKYDNYIKGDRGSL